MKTDGLSKWISFQDSPGQENAFHFKISGVINFSPDFVWGFYSLYKITVMD